MKKKVLLNVLLVSLMFLLLACGSGKANKPNIEANSESNDLITKEYAGIEFVFPAKWTCIEEDYYLKISSDDAGRFMILITKYEGDPSLSLEANLLKIYAAKENKIEITFNSVDTEISGQSAKEYTGQRYADGSHYKARRYIFPVGDLIVDILYLSYDDIYSENLAAFEEMIHSLELPDHKFNVDETDETSRQAEDSSATKGERNALSTALDELNYTAFSYSGLVDFLEYEGYSNKEATYGADNCGADWKEQAVKKAQDYTDTSSFSREELIDQLLYEGFTSDQAEHGASAMGY